MPALKTILHPTDFSESARYAFQAACSLARDLQARLILLHVVYPAPLSEWGSESLATMKQHLSWPQPPDPGVGVEHLVAEGDASTEILRVAQAIGCDLIVMGTHGRTGLGRLLTGSVAEEVLRNAPCPVLAVRVPLPETPRADTAAPAGPGNVVDVRPLGPTLASAQTQVLLRGSDTEVIRLIVPAGKEIAEHKAKGGVVVQCLEGKVAFSAFGKTQTLESGKLLYVPAGEPHAVKGIENAALLLTILLPRH
jgi:nucleotide-binding universal stress UspA family protein/quercetin dioxygenase-like cupin family protein